MAVLSLLLLLLLLAPSRGEGRRKTSAKLLDAQKRRPPPGMHRLEVKSDFKPEYADHLVSEWTLRNVCVTFHNWRGTLHRAQFISLDNMSAVIHSFSEYSFTFGRLAFVRPAEPHDVPALAQCEQRDVGLALTVTSNNLYHQFFHAVPAFLTLLPHVQPGAVFIPLVSYLASNWLHPATNYSHAWEFSLRALSRAPAKQLMADTLHLLDAPCTCFNRVEGATGAISLFYPKARSRILAFCRQAVKVARSMPPRALMPIETRASSSDGLVNILYVRRGSIKRALANDAEVSRAVCRKGSSAKVGWIAECVTLERLSLALQMRTLAAASVMLGVHGQAMVWMPFMLSDRSRAAVVEIMLPKLAGTKRSVSDRNMYGNVASALGIHHTAVVGELAAGCNTQKDILGCNVTVAVPVLLRVLHAASTHVRARVPSAAASLP
jgi:hypothetical protein